MSCDRIFQPAADDHTPHNTYVKLMHTTNNDVHRCCHAWTTMHVLAVENRTVVIVVVMHDV